MPGFLDKMKKGLDKGTKVISTRSSSLIETNKVKSELNALRKSKNEAFTEIGKKVYEGANEFSVDDIFDEIQSIKGYDVAIEEKEIELERIKAETESKLSELNTEPVEAGDLADAVEVDIEVQDKVEEAVEEVVEEVKDVDVQERSDN